MVRVTTKRIGSHVKTTIIKRNGTKIVSWTGRTPPTSKESTENSKPELK